jgi:hypothetical protein
VPFLSTPYPAVKSAGKPVELVVAADFNHFEIAESLGNPYVRRLP